MESRWSQMGRSKLRHYKDKTKAGLAIRKHLLDAGDVCFVDQGQLLELAHASGRLGTHQMALARVAALDFAVGGELEALPGAAVRFQFQFWFRCVSRHCWKSSQQISFRWLRRAGRTPNYKTLFFCPQPSQQGE